VKTSQVDEWKPKTSQKGIPMWKNIGQSELAWYLEKNIF
jgi:hypothetical protein